MMNLTVSRSAFKKVYKQLLPLSVMFALSGNAIAQQSYSPNHVYSGLEYSHNIVDEILATQNIANIVLPKSKELAVKPMHVYELHLSVIGEIYQYSLKNNRRPPPLSFSTPIKYTPTDVYYLTKRIMSSVNEIYRDGGGKVEISIGTSSGKTPTDVYQNLFELYYKMIRLNGKDKVSPSEVYAQIYRAKEDLQYSLHTLSNRLNEKKEAQKRLLITAIYGTHPDGSALSEKTENKTPKDVIIKAQSVRSKLNELRTKYKLPTIKIPSINSFGKVKPIDVFLQSQFIVAELNLLKMPLNLHNTTSNTKPVSGKKPSDVLHEMNHIEYMLTRILTVFQ